MKTANMSLNYDAAHLNTVEINNDMAPLKIETSSNDKIEILANIPIHSFVPGTNVAEHFIVDENGPVMTIDLEEIPEMNKPFLGASDSQVWIRVPKGIKVKATAENMPMSADGLENELSLHIENGPLQINNCSGIMNLESENGPIKISNSNGEIKITLENGPLSADNISGESITLESENGPVKIRSACFQDVKITNENSVIYYETLPLENGNFSFANENGVVQLSLPEDLGFVLDAESETGVIQCSLEAEISTEGDHQIIRRGDGSTKISIKTENGVIKIGANGQSDLSFLKLKMEELRKTIKSAVKPEDKEQVIKVLNTVVAAVEKAIGSVNEAKVKDSLTAATDKLKNLVDNFDVNDTKDKIVSTVEQIGDEVVDGLKIVIRKVKETHGEGFHKQHIHMHKEMDNLKEYLNKVMDSPLLKPYLGKGLNARDKQEVDERSRTKILEMLESGKITAEEAERLLKAIGKE